MYQYNNTPMHKARSVKKWFSQFAVRSGPAQSPDLWPRPDPTPVDLTGTPTASQASSLSISVWSHQRKSLLSLLWKAFSRRVEQIFFFFCISWVILSLYDRQGRDDRKWGRGRCDKRSPAGLKPRHCEYLDPWAPGHHTSTLMPTVLEWNHQQLHAVWV